jgi:hypothetical protein
VIEAHRQSSLKGLTSGFNRGFESPRHAHRVTGRCNGSIHKHSVSSHFKSLRGMAWGSDAGIDHYGHTGLLDDDFNL